MQTSTHPKPEVLAAFGRGELTPTDRVAVAEHLNACDTCCAALGQARNDTLNDTPAVQSPSYLQQTNPAPAISDAHFAPPGSLFSPNVPLVLANHPQYRIIDKLGEGGMGVVYKAEHRMMGREVALKVLAPHLTANPGAVDRFLKEVTAAGKLSHANIVISHDAGEAGGLHFLVMEFVEGISLDKLVSRRGPLPVTMASHFARQVALGLQHAFEKGMVHRDIKPQNLMVTRKGQVKILDFGLARLARDAETGERKSTATAPNLIMGTPDYLSPEQAKDSSTVDIRTDLYSLGCTLYFLLTGRTPFARATTLIDKLLAHTEEQPDPLLTFRIDVPEGLAAMLAKLMAKRPDDRYTTPAEAAAALAPYAKGIDATPPPAGSIAAVPGYEIVDAEVTKPIVRPGEFRFESEMGPEREKKPKKKKRRRSFLNRHRTLIGSIVAVILAGLIAGAVVKQIRKSRPVDAVPESASSKTPPPSQPPAPPPPAAKIDAKVLIVLPSRDVRMDEYKTIRQRLEQAGARVFTASGPPSFGPGYPLKVDYLLKPEMDVSEFSALVFLGRTSVEFAQPKSGAAFAAWSAIDRLRRQNRVLAAIADGECVLAVNGVFDGKSVANHAESREYPIIKGMPIKWENKDVVTDGKLVTASGTEHAVAFADAVVKALRGE